MPKDNLFDLLKEEPPYEELLQNYRDLLWHISDQEMELIERKREIEDYCQAFDEMQDELSEYR